MNLRSQMAFPVSGTKIGVIQQVKLGVLARDRSNLHLQRKIYHMVSGLICFALYAFVLTRTEALWVLGTVGGVWVTLDLLRFKVPAINNAALRLFGNLMRREELIRLTANSFYILGLFVIVAVFPKPIVLLSVLYLAVGDPVAAVAGTLYGRRRIVGKKSVEGAAANFLAALLVTFAYGAFYLGYSFPEVATLAIGGAAISVLAELTPAPVDDNFSIPVLSGIGLSLFLFLVPLG